MSPLDPFNSKPNYFILVFVIKWFSFQRPSFSEYNLPVLMLETCRFTVILPFTIDRSYLWGEWLRGSDSILLSTQARGLSAGPKNAADDLAETLGLRSGLLVSKNHGHGHKDSGFSSRVSEVGEDTEGPVADQALLDKKLARRLTRISECQNGAFYFLPFYRI